MTHILVTGAAGFIGAAVSLKLLQMGHSVVGVDNLNAYYDPALKEARLARLQAQPRFSFIRQSVDDRDAMQALFARETFDTVIHLAAQAGVRHSLEKPFTYTDSNITGFLTVLEGCRAQSEIKKQPSPHLVYASSSSVYGLNRQIPFSSDHPVDHPASLYAATKRANELMAHTYSHLFQIRTTGLRFFTVYGPWGRPDMALFLFTRKILAGEAIPLFNNGKHSRSFTYIDDIVEGVYRVVTRPAPLRSSAAAADLSAPNRSTAPFSIYNIGHSASVPLIDYVRVLEKNLGLTAKIQNLPMQAGDLPETAADISDLAADYDYSPKVSIDDGIAEFVTWYRSYAAGQLQHEA